QGSLAEDCGGSLGGKADAHNGKVRIDRLVDDDAGGARPGNVGGQVGKKVLQVRVIRGNSYVGVIRVSGAVIEDADVDPDPASGADGPVPRAVGGLVDDIDKCVRPCLHVLERATGHAAGPVEHQDDIRRVGGDIRGRREGQSDLQCAVTVDL